VRDEGKAPVVQAPLKTVRLWFIKPGGRVGVEGDLVPVEHQLRAFPNELARLVLRELERGPVYAGVYQAGYRTALRCCAFDVINTHGALSVPTPPPSWPGDSSSPTWTSLAAAAQIQRTLDELPGVRSVAVDGMTRSWVRSRLARGIDASTSSRPGRVGSCARAQRGGSGAGVGVRRISPTEVNVRVRAPRAVSIELDLDSAGEGGTATRDIVGATAAPCGIFDVRFSQGEVTGFGDADSRFLVRVVPLTGSAQPGVIRPLGTLIPPSS
jgi:hypothetical protein